MEKRKEISISLTCSLFCLCVMSLLPFKAEGTPTNVTVEELQKKVEASWAAEARAVAEAEAAAMAEAEAKAEIEIARGAEGESGSGRILNCKLTIYNLRYDPYHYLGKELQLIY